MKQISKVIAMGLQKNIRQKGKMNITPKQHDRSQGRGLRQHLQLEDHGSSTFGLDSSTHQGCALPSQMI